MTKDPSGDGLNIYAFVFNNSINNLDLFGLTSLTHVQQGVAFYTWHMGWLDRQHFSANSSLTKAWSKIQSAKGEDLVGFNISMHQAGKNSKAEFCLKVAKGEKDRKEQLLFAWMLLSNQFESYQGTGIQSSALANKIYGLLNYLRGRGELDKIPSSFSTEDLVSNLISFYATVEQKDPIDLVNSYAGRFDNRREERIISTAIWVFSLKPQAGYKKWTPLYFDHNEFLNRTFKLPKVGDASSNDRLFILAAQEAQKLLPKYIQKYGDPKMPSYFQQYNPVINGYVSIKKTNY